MSYSWTHPHPSPFYLIFIISLISFLLIDWLIDWLIECGFTPFQQYFSHITSAITFLKYNDATMWITSNSFQWYMLKYAYKLFTVGCILFVYLLFIVSLNRSSRYHCKGGGGCRLFVDLCSALTLFEQGLISIVPQETSVFCGLIWIPYKYMYMVFYGKQRDEGLLQSGSPRDSRRRRRRRPYKVWHTKTCIYHMSVHFC